jgi:hypothetical protein
MGWIKLDWATVGKPELDMMGRLLSCPLSEVLGSMVRLWVWADQQGVVESVELSRSSLERYSGLEGIGGALSAVGWAEDNGDGMYRLVNFSRHNGPVAKRRAEGTKRMRRLRSLSGQGSSDPPKGPVRVAYTLAFDAFWFAYPPAGRVAKRKAFEAWKRHVRDEERHVVLDAAFEYAKCGKVLDGFCRHATTWLNGRAWEDDRASWGANGGSAKGPSFKDGLLDEAGVE